MNRREWGRIGMAVVIAGTVAASAGWVGDLVVPANYPARSSYQVPGLTEPTVALASLQRSWPAGLDQAGSQYRLIGFMNAIWARGWPPPIPLRASGRARSARPATALIRTVPIASVPICGAW